MATRAEFFLQHNRESPPNALINPYRTGDGHWLLLIAAHENAWPRLASAIGMRELMGDARFATKSSRAENAAEIVASLDPVFASGALAHWKRTLDAAGIVYATIEHPDEVVRDRQMIADAVYATLVEPLGGACSAGASPLWLAGYDEAVTSRLSA